MADEKEYKSLVTLIREMNAPKVEPGEATPGEPTNEYLMIARYGKAISQHMRNQVQNKIIDNA